MREAGGGRRVVLVLGGGGAKALAHAGAWQALQERNAHITHIVGTSLGAVIGADAPLVDVLYASCALPLYFSPASIAGRRLADGGLRAVLPLQVAARLPADLVVAVHVGPGFDETLPPPTVSARPVPPLIRAH